MLLFTFFLTTVSCQDPAKPYDYNRYYQFSESDSIRGTLGPMRSCYDVGHYLLDVQVDPVNKTIEGSVKITAQATVDMEHLQIDLFDNMTIDAINYQGQSLDYTRKHDAVFIDIPLIEKGKEFILTVKYHGIPIAAKNAPWDGGFTWSQDENGTPWIGISCESIGASLWWPNKDHLSDEPDSMDVIARVPEGLMAVANGDLMSESSLNGLTSFHWKVDYSINNYNVTLNIADYSHFSDVYTSEVKGDLPLDYYVLKENRKKAEKHFQQTPGVLEAFEYWFGPYPFWEDGFALVETPYLGMEHQSAIAYGNKYKRGYLGRLQPAVLNFDYIIVHEAGHEWWGNSVSCKDHAEMWIHESFTTYMEALYVEFHHGKEIATEYLGFQKGHIANRQPIVGPLDVNFDSWRGSDHYYKGAWILHTLRHAVPESHDWQKYLQSIYSEFAMSHAETSDIVNFTNGYFNQNFTPFFDQYLRHQDIPVFEYRWIKAAGKKAIEYRWNCHETGFDMPFYLIDGDQKIQLQPTTEWQTFESKGLSTELNFPTDLFLVDIEEL